MHLELGGRSTLPWKLGFILLLVLFFLTNTAYLDELDLTGMGNTRSATTAATAISQGDEMSLGNTASATMATSPEGGQDEDEVHALSNFNVSCKSDKRARDAVGVVCRTAHALRFNV